MSDYNLQVTAGLNVSESKSLITSQLQSIMDGISKSKSAKITCGLDTDKMKSDMQSRLNSVTKDLKLDNIGKQASSSASDLSKVTQEFRNMGTQAQNTKQTSGGFFSNLKSQMGSTITTMLKYQTAYKIIQETTQAIKAMVTEVCDLDKNLTEFNKVADLTTSGLSNFTDKAYESSDKIGRTGQDMIKAATEFKRAGYDVNQSLDMGSTALVMTNVADGIDSTADSAGTLISVLKGFNMNESDIMSIVDKMNSVSNQSPVGFDDLANGLERVSGTMEQSGNSIDQTIGLLTGGFGQLRNMEKVSSGLITISQRLRGVGEDGEAVDGLSAKLEEDFGKIGVAIEDSNGDLRSTYNIVTDYSKVFSTLSSEQKQYYGELAAGKRQVNVWNAMVQQAADVQKAVAQSQDSVGSAANENEIYRQSVEGLKNEFGNAFSSLSREVVSSDWIKSAISAGTDFLVVLTNIVSQDSLISGTIGVITEGVKGLASVLKSLSGNDVIGTLMKGFMTYKTISAGVGLFDFFKGKKQNNANMSAFFQSAVNGTLQVKDGFLNVGEAINNVNKKSKGLGKRMVSVAPSEPTPIRLCNNAA